MTTPRRPPLTALEASGLSLPADLEPELKYLCRHALRQAAAYASLLQADRQRWHWVVGETLAHARRAEA